MRKMINEKDKKILYQHEQILDFRKNLEILEMKKESLETKKSDLEVKNTQQKMSLIEKDAEIENSKNHIEELIEENNQLKYLLEDTSQQLFKSKSGKEDMKIKLLKLNKELNNMNPLVENYECFCEAFAMVVQNFDLHRNVYFKNIVDISTKIEQLEQVSLKKMRFEYDKGMFGVKIYEKLGAVFRKIVIGLRLLNKKCNEMIEYEKMSDYL